MSAVFVDSPGENWFPAGQRLIYTLGSQTTPLDAAYRFIIQVEENGTEISKIYLTPNPNERSFFDLSEVVKGRTEVDPFRYNTTTAIHSFNNQPFTRANNGVNRYTVRVGYYDGSENLDEDNQTLYLVDGYEQISDGLHPSFADFYGTQSNRKVWLTDRVPSNNVIEIKAGIEDQGLAAFLNTDDTGSLIERLLFKIYDTSGTLDDTLTYDINATNGGLVPSTNWAANATNVKGSLLYTYAYPGAFSALVTALNAVVGGWSYYDVIPSTGLNVQTGNVLRVTNDCRYTKNEAVQLGWANTRGGWDYLRFNGKKQKTVSREEKTYRKIVGDYSASTFSFGTSERQVKPYQLEAKESYQLNGILTIEEITLMQYCLRSKNVMARIDGLWVPVTIKTSSMQIEEETVSKVFVITFDVELAQIIRC